MGGLFHGDPFAASASDTLPDLNPAEGEPAFKAVIDYGRCRGSCDREYVDWYLTIVLVTVFLNIDETELLGTINLGWTLFMMSCLNLALQSKKASASASGIAMGCRDKTLSLSTV